MSIQANNQPTPSGYEEEEEETVARASWWSVFVKMAVSPSVKVQAQVQTFTVAL